MEKNILAILVLCICLFAPHLAIAECTELGSFTNWELRGDNTVVLYYGSKPTAQFDVQSCGIQPNSRIELIKTYVCDGEEILIDGYKCTIMEIKPLN